MGIIGPRKGGYEGPPPAETSPEFLLERSEWEADMALLEADDVFAAELGIVRRPPPAPPLVDVSRLPKAPKGGSAQSGRPAPPTSVPTVPSPDDLARQIHDQYKGLKNAGRLIVLPSGFGFQTEDGRPHGIITCAGDVDVFE